MNTELRSGSTWRRRRITLFVFVCLLCFAAAALAAEAPSRAEYVTRLESICRPGAEATEKVMRGARADLQQERLPVAAGKFARASSIFAATIREISAIPRPPADGTRLKKWFIYLKRQESYLQQITVQLRAGHAVKAQRLTARFIHNGNLANNVVLAFGFDYCSFKFSRYG
jgi:hypothetical protein